MHRPRDEDNCSLHYFSRLTPTVPVEHLSPEYSQKQSLDSPLSSPAFLYSATLGCQSKGRFEDIAVEHRFIYFSVANMKKGCLLESWTTPQADRSVIDKKTFEQITQVYLLSFLQKLLPFTSCILGKREKEIGQKLSAVSFIHCVLQPIQGLKRREKGLPKGYRRAEVIQRLSGTSICESQMKTLRKVSAHPQGFLILPLLLNIFFWGTFWFMSCLYLKEPGILPLGGDKAQKYKEYRMLLDVLISK